MSHFHQRGHQSATGEVPTASGAASDHAYGAPTIWAVLNADSLEDAQRQVEGYPMYAFMRLTYTPLR